MKVLAYDSTGPIITAAIVENGEVLGRLDQPADRRKGNTLELVIDRILGKAKLTREQIDGLALVTGPGSLTATRIGWATAAGWAQAAGIPVTGWRVPMVQARRWEGKRGVVCCVHFRADQFLLYDLDAGAPFHPISVSLSERAAPTLAIQTLTGPGLIGNRDRWKDYLGVGTTLLEESELIVGGDYLGKWGEDDLTRGQELRLDQPPLDYGLPPDFKKRIAS